MGWLAQIQSNHFTCQVYHKLKDDTYELEYGFDRIQKVGFQILNLIAGTDILFATTTIAAYRLNCWGGSKVPNPALSSSPLNVYWYDSSYSLPYSSSSNTASPSKLLPVNSLTV